LPVRRIDQTGGMGIQIYIDGRFVPKEQATVSVYDHGFLYGDGIFEGLRAYNGRIFKLREHLERLYESAHHVMLDIPLSMEEIKEAALETVRRNNLRDAYIRIIVSRGAGDLGLDPKKCSRASIIIIADKITLFPQEFYEQGLKAITVATRQRISDTLEPRIKSLNYLNNILVKIEAANAGAVEGIMLNNQGYVVESSGANIFIVDKSGSLITPPAYLGILEGVTRNAVIEIARDSGFTVLEKPFTRHDLYIARECFLTGTAAELVPVISIDSRIIGEGVPGPVTRRLMRDYSEYAQSNGTEIYPQVSGKQVSGKKEAR